MLKCKILNKIAISVTILLILCSAPAFAANTSDSFLANNDVFEKHGTEYKDLPLDVKMELSSEGISEGTKVLTGKYLEVTYQNAPEDIKTQYEANCREINKSPMPDDVILIPMPKRVKRSATSGYPLGSTSDISAYRDNSNGTLKFYYRRLWYTFKISDTYVGYKFINRGPQVALLQFVLNEYGYRPGNIDEIFGSQTHSSLLLWQGDQSLTCDGIAGPKVWYSF